jgi:hypothetical protein
MFAAFSPILKAENNGGYVIAWGRIEKLPEDIAKAMRSNEDGGDGRSQKFWDHCELETKEYL